MRHRRRLNVAVVMVGLIWFGIATLSLTDATWARLLGALATALGVAAPAWVSMGSAQDLRRRLAALEEHVAGLDEPRAEMLQIAATEDARAAAADQRYPESPHLAIVDGRTRAILETLTSLRVGPIHRIEQAVEGIAGSPRPTDREANSVTTTEQSATGITRAE